MDAAGAAADVASVHEQRHAALRSIGDMAAPCGSCDAARRIIQRLLADPD